MIWYGMAFRSFQQKRWQEKIAGMDLHVGRSTAMNNMLAKEITFAVQQGRLSNTQKSLTLVFSSAAASTVFYFCFPLVFILLLSTLQSSDFNMQIKPFIYLFCGKQNFYMNHQPCLYKPTLKMTCFAQFTPLILTSLYFVCKYFFHFFLNAM